MKLYLENEDEVSSLSNVINEISNSKKMFSNIVFETKPRKLYLDDIESMSFIILGDSLVGKTNFQNRFSDEFKEITISTIGTNRKTYYYKIGEDIMRIDLLDTAGQERFRNYTLSYCKNLNGIFLLFDVTNEETFNNLNSWLNGIIRK